MSRFKKLLFSAVATMAIAAGVAVSPASATVPTEAHFNAQANVPYLAWRGEHIRLGYCLPDGNIPVLASVTWTVEDWSGDPANGSIPVPKVLSQFNANGCAYAVVSSQKAGVAFVKLHVSDPGLLSRTPGQTEVDKFFIAAWMQISTPKLTGGGDVDAGDFACRVQIQDALLIRSDQADPFRVCANYDPRHRVTATVKGTIPLLANFGEWGLGTTLTMPDDWNAWAQRAAADVIDHPNTIVGNLAATNWDIHDSQMSSLDTHVIHSPAQCDGATNLADTTDTVDNCALTPLGGLPAFGGTHGWFSTVFGVPSRSGFSDGPFDPLYTNDTMLSDGIVDAGDAPMPAAQIDVDIAENKGGTDKGGVGYLVDPKDSNPLNATPGDPNTLLSYKSEPYSRDGKGTDVAHNYDSPFYYQYLPATSRPVSGAGSPYGAVQPSGIDGASDTGGFSGFLNNNGNGGLYRNWDFAWETTYHPGTLSNCLDYQSIFQSFTPHYRPLPYGTSSVSVYSDEHGEADVWYVPGFGYYFPGSDSNGGCDLRLVDPLGSAHITVTARYPYQPVTPSDPSATLDFTVHSKWAKTLAVFPKGGTPDTLYTRIVVAHAQDIDGSPLENETVCWTTNDLQAGTISAFPSGPGGDIYASYDATGKGIGDVIVHIDPVWAHNPSHTFVNAGRFCTTTDEKGNTAIEFSESHQKSVDIVAHWENEAITRDIPVAFSETGGTAPQLSDTGPVTHIPSPTQIKAAAAATAAGTVGPVLSDGVKPKAKVIKSVKLKKAVYKIRLARVYKPFHGKRVLQVRVNGKSGMVALKITIKLGKKTHTYKRFVPANKYVAVKNLPVPAQTAKVTVSLLGA